MSFTAGNGHLAVTFFENIQVAPLGTYVYPMDITNYTRLNPFLKVVYDATHAVASGVTVDQRYGMALGSGVLMAQNVDPVTSLVPTPLAQPGTTTVVSTWNAAIGVLSKIYELTFTNTDATNIAVISLYGDR